MGRMRRLPDQAMNKRGTYQQRHPEDLIGQSIVAVSITYHEGYEGLGVFAEIVLTLMDGRRFEFSSCDCCGGVAFGELMPEEQA